MERLSTEPAALPPIGVEYLQSDLACVTLRGEHDLNSKEALLAAFATAGNARRVLVDLSDCTFIDSTVIATLVFGSKDAERRGAVLAIVLPPQATSIRRITTITNLDTVVPIHDSSASAIASFSEA
jgi:anti-anti-sigma factor